MNYFRITVYNPKYDFSAILDSNGKYSELWEFSAYLVSKGFKIIEVGANENLIEGSFKTINEQSNKIFVRGVARGRPIIQNVTYDNRPCKAISVYDKAYGLFTN
jgi:hypothetical protein